MHHEPESTDPTTHREPQDVDAHVLQGGKKVPPGPADVEAHVNVTGRPPIVDDVQAHTIKGHGPAETAQPAADVDAHHLQHGEPAADGDK
jgi:hypothetical protein